MKFFLFDIGNVLVDFDFQELYRAIAADSGRPVEPPTDRDREMQDAVERGKISDQDLVDYLNEAKGLSWTVERLTEIWAGMFSINETGQKLFFNSIERGLSVCALSNIAKHNVDAIERNQPGLFAGATRLFFSYEMGLCKPDPEIYRQVLNELGVEGELCLFIDDRSENIEAARAAGIHAHQFIPENHSAVHQAVSGFFG